MVKTEIELKHEEGFHARPAGLFVKTASKYNSEIKLLKNGDQNKEYNPKSIISIMSMGAIKGDRITIIADGQDEKEAVENLRSLVENDFVIPN
ncbi:HPr family phosphocarrier protein [Halanaerobium hydrogeniformans]|uniref:Phosphotransferase system, phosphocarrier protein HPr n=1 Tax=Halanaerobium hydrogeniformans TaxID=656519 RepID=E4RK53_HALHG|nr:HPr family phosphocarrier protein [Halanaerobium hydrogeniformans]ADQ14605.1 Phosphotransferase system, phosphocarrier protein HPr [Halanaerobium hydrogeniformans]